MYSTNGPVRVKFECKYRVEEPRHKKHERVVENKKILREIVFGG